MNRMYFDNKVSLKSLVVAFVLQITVNGVLSWRAVDQHARWWVVMKRNEYESDWSVHAILPSDTTSIQLDETTRHSSNEFYAVRAMNAASVSGPAVLFEL